MQNRGNLKCSVGNFEPSWRGKGMARNPDETRFQLQRDRVLRAAAHCFNHKGYSGTSLKDVANMLDLTDAALYYYVRNKEELVYLCYVRAASERSAKVRTGWNRSSCTFATTLMQLLARTAHSRS